MDRGQKTENKKQSRLPPTAHCLLLTAHCLLLTAHCLLLAGCAHSGLNAARENFFLGKYDDAAVNLQDISGEETNRILLLMERGTVQQARGRYRDSTLDWVSAWELAARLDYRSLSRETASLAVNQRVKMFQGMPYERTLLHAFAAKSYFAMEMWDDAAVEARNIIYRSQKLDDFPDSAYTRYLSGVCMEMIYDLDAASRQYREADKLAPHLKISEAGKISPKDKKNQKTGTRNPELGTELICFVLIGRAPTEFGIWSENYKWGTNPYAEFYSGDKYLGRSYYFSNIKDLLAATQKRLAGLRALKDISRVAVKETLAQVVSNENEILGELVRLVLFSLETSEERRWETLPMWLQVARVPCPDGLEEYRVRFRGAKERVICEKTVTVPLSRRGDVYVSFCRDIKKSDSTTKPGLSSTRARKASENPYKQ